MIAECQARVNRDFADAPRVSRSITPIPLILARIGRARITLDSLPEHDRLDG
jgi:hypothetical protein